MLGRIPCVLFIPDLKADGKFVFFKGEATAGSFGEETEDPSLTANGARILASLTVVAKEKVGKENGAGKRHKGTEGQWRREKKEL